jgi:hypothetical protein
MVHPGVKQRGKSSRIATRRWNSRMTMTNPLLLPRVSSRVPTFLTGIELTQAQFPQQHMFHDFPGVKSFHYFAL